ncbi:phytanoyl-CoA dioxygenase family protein [Sneathiella sp.]|uniref:phytanoyl-CoA dioxygenase family protein n=1 Tax=Sneathiella sp. TaxID=1964365 RepID=UPI002FDFF24A
MTNGFGLDQLYEISDDAVERFHAEGWAPLPGLIDPALAREILDRLNGSDNLVNPSSTEKWMTDNEYARVLRMHDGMAWKDDWFKDIALSPRLSSLALKLMRKEEGLFIHDMSFFKPGTESEPTPHHQDFCHWPFDRTGAFTIWIALTDIDEDMGPLYFLPGSHREGPLGRYSHRAGDDVCAANPGLLERYGKAAGKALRAGDATVHLDLSIHGANANTTGRDRAAYTLRYMPTDVIYTGAPHRHFDQFGMKSGDKFAESPRIPRIRRAGA